MEFGTYSENACDEFGEDSTRTNINTDNITIDASTGNVVVKSLIKHAMRHIHDSSVLRAVNRVLKDSGGAEMSTTLVKGRHTKTATVDLCCYILDKTSGPAWSEWRESSGPAFKRALRERDESVRASGQVEQARPPVQRVEEQVEEVETKAVVLRNALLSVNITGSVRIDEASGMVSGIDVIRMLCPKRNSDYAAQMLTRVLEKDDREPSIKSRVSYIKINGSGKKTPITNFSMSTCWELPAIPAIFRVTCSELPSIHWPILCFVLSPFSCR